MRDGGKEMKRKEGRQKEVRRKVSKEGGGGEK